MRVICLPFGGVIRMHEETLILVTGATGFVGSAVVRALRAGGRRFVALGKRPDDARDGEAWESIDLLNRDEVAALMARHRPAVLIHAAWARSRPGGMWDAPDNTEWRDAGLMLFDAFARAGGRHITACGSCAEYAPCDTPCVEGVTPVAPASLYGTAKAELHDRAATLCADRGLSLSWARIFYLFGPNEGAARLVPSVIDSLLRGETAETASGTIRRDFAFIDDVAGGLLALADAGVTGAYNVGSGDAIMLRDLVTRIGAIMGRPDLVAIGALPDRGGEAPLIAGDVSKIARDTGWHARTPLDEALRRTIDWRRSNGCGVRSDDRQGPAKL